MVPISEPACASDKPFARDSSSLEMRLTSNGVASSCQPACAAVESVNNAAPNRKPLGVDTRLLPLGLFTTLGRHPTLEHGGRRHADHVEAGVDEMHFAGDAADRSLSKYSAAPPTWLSSTVVLERGMALVPFEHHARIAHRRSPPACASDRPRSHSRGYRRGRDRRRDSAPRLPAPPWPRPSHCSWASRAARRDR